MIEGLVKSARDHAVDIGEKGIVGHKGSKDETMSDRIDRYGEWNGKIGENIDFGSNDAVEILLSLLIDDGVPSRGHRKNIFNPDYKLIGIASHPHVQEKICCVMDFASFYTPKGS